MTATQPTPAVRPDELLPDPFDCAQGRRYALLLAWEAGIIDIDTACRSSGLTPEELFDLEDAVLARGRALARMEDAYRVRT